MRASVHEARHLNVSIPVSTVQKYFYLRNPSGRMKRQPYATTFSILADIRQRYRVYCLPCSIRHARS